MAIIPNTIMPVRTNAPIIRDINLSKKARILTPIGPLTDPAEIWRKGENKVANNIPIEK
jgi:hypothetical protein